MKVENQTNTCDFKREFPVVGSPNNPLDYFPVISGKYFSYFEIDVPSLSGKKRALSVEFIPTAIDALLNIGLVTCVAIPLITLSTLGDPSAVGLDPSTASAISGTILVGAFNYFGAVNLIGSKISSLFCKKKLSYEEVKEMYYQMLADRLVNEKTRTS